MEEELAKVTSQSIQVSQEVRQKYRKALVDERRFTRLPNISSRTANYSDSAFLSEN